jgi:hypothetical protein
VGEDAVDVEAAAVAQPLLECECTQLELDSLLGTFNWHGLRHYRGTQMALQRDDTHRLCRARGGHERRRSSNFASNATARL